MPQLLDGAPVTDPTPEVDAADDQEHARLRAALDAATAKLAELREALRSEDDAIRMLNGRLGGAWTVANTTRAERDRAKAKLSEVEAVCKSRAISDRALGHDPRFAFDVLAIIERQA